MAMLDFTERPPLAEETSRPRASLLGREVILIAWDVSQTVRTVAPLSIAGGRSVAPTASLRLTRADGGTRLLWALRCPSDAPLHVTLSTGVPGQKADLVLEADAGVAPVDAAELLDGVDAAGRVALVSALFNLWTALFRLQRSRVFTRILRALVRHLAPKPKPAQIVSRIADDLVLLQTSVVAGFGKIDAIHLIGEDGPSRLSGQPHRTPGGSADLQMLHLIADRRATGVREALLVFIGPDGLTVRALAAPEPRLPPLVRWLREQAQAAPGLREYLLNDISSRSETGRAIALEAQLRAPLQPKRVIGGMATPSAEVACALATPSGTLVTGRYHDPIGLVAGIDALGADGSMHDLTPAMYRFPIDVEGPGEGVRLNATGFAVMAPAADGPVPILQPRFRLRLKSGAYHTLVPAPQPADPIEARALALRAVPPRHVDEPLLAGVLAPVIADLHAQVGAGIGQPSTRQIGTPLARPKASVVIPLYKVLEFLRFQIAAFATDPWFRAHAELIYVLDSPEQAGEVEHLLTGLHLVYGLPMTLVCMARNGGYARACNAGAAVARGNVLALVNSDIIPTRAGWLEQLVARLGRRVGAVGPKLLFEDGSIQHAGMYFARDHRGRWLNHHFHKGMPRDYVPANEERIVPAVTGACLVLPRDLFEKVGGFTHDYVIGDYEDSDLCLKITMAERKIAYVPEVELYHLERKSMVQSVDYMNGIAWQYNCALHAARWSELIAAIMQSGGRRRRTRSAAA